MTAAGTAVAIAFVALAGASALTRAGPWQPLHLLLAGAAGVAIASVMPFFSAALAAAPPAAPIARAAVIGSIGTGALVVSATVPVGSTAVAIAGGALYVAGVAGLAFVTLAPLRRALGPRRRPVVVAYAAACAFVASGVALVLLMLAGWVPVVAAWALLKPAHAWLNLVGFVVLVIAGTLIHLLPTVLGSRIAVGRLADTAVGGLMAGVALVAIGFALAADLVVRAGALAALVGSAGLVGYAWRVARPSARGRWTTDAAWHLFTGGSLSAATGWLAAGVGLAAAPILVHGARPEAWSLALVAPPLALGCALQALLGSASHLVPAIGPGSGASRAQARATLGRAATARLVATNAGIATVAVAAPAGQVSLAVAGLLAVGLSALGTGLPLVLCLLRGTGRITRTEVALTV